MQRLLQCTACRARFRVEISAITRVESSIPCPKCQAAISLTQIDAPAWVPRSHASVFGTRERDRRQEFVKPPAPPSAPAKSRNFQDVTMLRRAPEQRAKPSAGLERGGWEELPLPDIAHTLPPPVPESAKTSETRIRPAEDAEPSWVDLEDSQDNVEAPPADEMSLPAQEASPLPEVASLAAQVVRPTVDAGSPNEAYSGLGDTGADSRTKTATGLLTSAPSTANPDSQATVPMSGQDVEAIQPARRKLNILKIIALVIFVSGLTAFVTYSLNRHEELPPQIVERTIFVTEPAPEQTRIDPDLDYPTEELKRLAEEAIEEANFGQARKILQELKRRVPEDVETGRSFIQTLMGAGEYHLARQTIVQEAIAHGIDDDLKDAFSLAILRDTSLYRPIFDMVQEKSFDTIRALGGGRSVSLRMELDGERVYAFKPSQIEWEEGWRAEVASWHFCEVIPCGFYVPRSMASSITRRDFERLYPMDRMRQRTYAERFDELVWINGPTSEADILQGVLKDWEHNLSNWPIEYSFVWEPWVHHGADETLLDQPLETAVAGLRPYGEHFRTIMRQQGDATTREMARQISNALLFDYLTNNWDRFSVVEDYYGVNHHYRDGVMISLDNGAAFHTQPMIQVRNRFMKITRFSRSMVTALKLLTRSRHVDDVFFPNPSAGEKERLDVFWSQHELALERIDQLVEEFGEDAILYFP